MIELKISDLNQIYSEAEDADREVFAEQRSNILLVAGDHYQKKSSRYGNSNGRLRDSRDFSENQKLRLTKNHMHKIYRHYVANILAYAPGVAILPQKDSELQDQKDAELNQSVWSYFKDRYRMKEKVRNFCQDFIGLGEVACKIFFDPNAGDLKGYEADVEMDPEGNVVTDETGGISVRRDENGKPIEDQTKPVFKGGFVFERIFGFNLMRAPGATSMEDSKYLIIRKMADSKHLKKLYKDDKEKLKFVEESQKDSFIVFDTNRSEYTTVKNQTLIKEFYWKPCFEYPRGYFAITTDLGILAKDELPYGIFPIVWQGCDEFPTTPRGRSILKQARPFQAEINRASSQMALHQVSLGDDKIIYQTGTKLAPGALLPGVRGLTYSGMEPQILPGRDGGQFLPYIRGNIEELYDVMEMSEEGQAHPLTNTEPQALLFASLKQLRKYAIYGEKFEQFLVDMCSVSLDLARYYLPDDELIYAIGKDQQINVQEFRDTTKLCYQIKLEPRNETIETQMGKFLVMSQALQYLGGKLEKEDLGTIIKNMPFGNWEDSFKGFTINRDNVMNDMLQMERGQTPLISAYDDHPYIIKHVTSRMRRADYRFLSPQVKMLYERYIVEHEKIATDQARKAMAAQSDMIPVGGAMVAVDLYVQNPQDPTKAAKRLRVPSTSVEWLMKRLEDQGNVMSQAEGMSGGVKSDLASLLERFKNQQQPTTSGAPVEAQPAPQGPASPIGVS